jgi:hypothetical protein
MSVDGRRRPEDFLKLASMLALVVHLVGCAFTNLPTATEKTAIGAAEKAIILLRVECTIENQQPYEPFDFSMVDDNISFGLGTFETGGEPKRLVPMHRFLSPESRQSGWTYFVLSPGTYYLAVYPPRRTDTFTYQHSLQYAPRWRIDIPKNARLVYAGTVHLTGESDWLLFGGRIMRSIQEISVRNDEDLAGKISSKYFSDIGPMDVALMRRHESEPIILRSPLPAFNR